MGVSKFLGYFVGSLSTRIPYSQGVPNILVGVHNILGYTGMEWGCQISWDAKYTVTDAKYTVTVYLASQEIVMRLLMWKKFVIPYNLWLMGGGKDNQL